MAIKSQGCSKDVRELIKLLRSEGCEVRPTSNGHWFVTRPGYRSISLTSTPRDYRALANAKADIKRNLGITI